MRLLERTLKWVRIAPRSVREDALGGLAEGFSEVHFAVRASVIPSTGGIRNHETGAQEVQSMCLLMPLDAQISVGDGVCVENLFPEWRCVDVQRWTAHLAARLERIPHACRAG